MISKTFFLFYSISRQLWVRASLISLLAVFAAAISPLFAPFMPNSVFAKIDEATVRSLLDILANSMLAVTTFSLTIMVTTQLAVSQQITPRAHRVLREDPRTQIVLATFVGAFVFAMTGIVMLQTGIAGSASLPVLYIAALIVVGLVIVAILRWIGHLSSLGSVEETTRKVELEARDAMRRRMETPFLGGRRRVDLDVPPKTSVIPAERSGYIQHMDVAAAQACLIKYNAAIWVEAMPGDWVGEGEAVALYSGAEMDDSIEATLSDIFTIGDTRTFAQDAGFGASVLTEIAERALSPSTNDPMTAIDIITRQLALLEDWSEEIEPEDVAAPNVYVPPIDIAGWVDSAFHPIARDGAAFVEVGLHVQHALTRLSRHRVSAVADAARLTAHRALREAELGLRIEADLARVRAAAPDALS